MIELQYDLFEEQPSEIDLLKKDSAELKVQLEKYRKSMFAKIGSASKENIELIERVHRLEFEFQALKKMISVP